MFPALSSISGLLRTRAVNLLTPPVSSLRPFSFERLWHCRIHALLFINPPLRVSSCSLARFRPPLAGQGVEGAEDRGQARLRRQGVRGVRAHAVRGGHAPDVRQAARVPREDGAHVRAPDPGLHGEAQGGRSHGSAGPEGGDGGQRSREVVLRDSGARGRDDEEPVPQEPPRPVRARARALPEAVRDPRARRRRERGGASGLRGDTRISRRRSRSGVPSRRRAAGYTTTRGS